MANFNQQRKPNPQVQIGAMRKYFPDFKYRRKGNNVVFTGDLFVTPEIPIYTVSIECGIDISPIVKVKNPVLHPKAPHIFKGKCLCLYHKNNFRWDDKKLITNEIIHWTISWIYFYEYWLQSGEWVAPEIPHSLGIKL
jgi:hypothetical protein